MDKKKQEAGTTKPKVVIIDKDVAKRIFDEIIKKDAEVLRRLAQ